MTLLAALLGAAFAGGACLVFSGWSGSGKADHIQTWPSHTPVHRVVNPALQRRLALAAGFGLPVGLITRWPVGAIAFALLGWFAPELFGSKGAREAATAKTEGIAAWTEMLRDTIQGAHGIEEAIVTTATVAPQPIRSEVEDLAVRLERQPLDAALRSFATDLAHPIGDLVVASLTLASQGAVGDLAELLGTLAVTAREEAGMRLRVEAARARLRTSVRVIAGCTAATALGLVLFNRRYLNVYEGAVGQMVLAIVAALWGASLWWLSRMGDFIAPERFLAATDDLDTDRVTA